MIQCPRCKRDAINIKRGYCNSCYSVLMRQGVLKRKFVEDVVITDTQREFITGCLLGDGWISNLKYGRKNPSFGIDRKQDDLEYLQWQYGFVQNLCSRDVVLKDKLNKTSQRTQKHCLFETRFLPSLLEFRKLWYPNEIKIVPPDLKLTKLICQIWYCDDGSIETNHSAFRIKLSTHGFTRDEVAFLMSLLESRYNEKFVMVKDHPQNEQYCIRGGVDATVVFLSDLQGDFPPGMKRKMPLEALTAKINKRG